jgi:diaminopimelate epimerase
MRKSLEFHKYHGAGNDFIIIDDRALDFPREIVAKLCHRSFGIGADGLILLQPATRGDYRMLYFNADGNEASMCGNGIRCLVDYIYRFVEAKDSYLIETEKQLIFAKWEEGKVSIEFPSSSFLKESYQGIELYLLDTGVPHALFFVEDLNFEFVAIAREIRAHFNANVNAAKILMPDKIAIRTYERGIEGETLACGSGAAAVAWVIASRFGKQEIEIIPSSRESLYFKIDRDSFLMTGPATFVFSGFMPVALNKDFSEKAEGYCG